MTGFGGTYMGADAIDQYGCVKCQTTHYADEPIYRDHIGWQSKHGIKRDRDPRRAARPDETPSDYAWPAWVDALPPLPDGARLVPWHFIADGSLDYGASADHDFAVWIGSEWWCAGCLAYPPSHFTDDGHVGWPSLDHAPNGLRIVLAYKPAERMMRRPLCPRRGAT